AAIEVVEDVEIDADVVAAEHLEVTEREAMNAAMLAELPARDLAAPLVGRQVVLAGDERERVGLHDRADRCGLRAHRAVAHAAAGAEIERGLEANRTAVAAAGVRARGWGRGGHRHAP